MTTANAARPREKASARGSPSSGATSPAPPPPPRDARRAVAWSGARGGAAVVTSGSLTSLAARLVDERRVDRAGRVRHRLRLADGLPELARLLVDVVDRARARLR